jgi:DNA modification methylase
MVTSPPYFGLRSYLPENHPLKHQEIELEQSINAYVNQIVMVFREVWRVLRDDGTAWLNIADSYAGSNNGSNDYRDTGSSISKNDNKYGKHKPMTDIPAKSLCLIPERVVIALQQDGWIIRNDNIWAKSCSGNYTGGTTMPESIKDRFTRAHEYVYFLTKQPNYYFDHEAALEPALYDGRKDTMFKGSQKYKLDATQTASRDGGERWPQRMRGFKTKDQIVDMQHHGQDINYSEKDGIPARNRRDVWVINPASYPGAHYATFPPDLIEPCILTGCPEGGVVLDPFIGSGTTCAVARKHGRHAIGLDLNFEYLTKNARERLQYGSYVPIADGVKQLTIGGLHETDH